MNELYTEQELSEIRARLKKRGLILTAVSAVLFAGIVTFFILRLEVPAVIFVILLGTMLIFCYDLFCRPLRRYARHIDSALHGRTHEQEFVFSQATENHSLIDGIACRDLIFLGEPDKHGQMDCLFYWDEAKDIPAFCEGQNVKLKYYDKFIVGWQNG